MLQLFIWAHELKDNLTFFKMKQYFNCYLKVVIVLPFLCSINYIILLVLSVLYYSEYHHSNYICIVICPNKNHYKMFIAFYLNLKLSPFQPKLYILLIKNIHLVKLSTRYMQNSVDYILFTMFIILQVSSFNPYTIEYSGARRRTTAAVKALRDSSSLTNKQSCFH